jgi:uncharacterized protein (DUF2461 family)
MTSYDSLLGHIEHHNVRKWLVDGCEREDANTIREAISRLSDGQLQRRFARMLCGYRNDRRSVLAIYDDR